jgi:hypothetical protein
MSNIKMLLEQAEEDFLEDEEEEELTYAEARHADSAEKAGDEALDYGGR